jgi:hypothetical protein
VDGINRIRTIKPCVILLPDFQIKVLYTAVAVGSGRKQSIILPTATAYRAARFFLFSYDYTFLSCAMPFFRFWWGEGKNPELKFYLWR